MIILTEISPLTGHSDTCCITITNIHFILSWLKRVVHPLAIVVLLSELWSLSFSILQYERTPLMWAAREGYADIVQLLLSAGANIEAATNVILMNHYWMAVWCVCGPNNNIHRNNWELRSMSENLRALLTDRLSQYVLYFWSYFQS